MAGYGKRTSPFFYDDRAAGLRLLGLAQWYVYRKRFCGAGAEMDGGTVPGAAVDFFAAALYPQPAVRADQVFGHAGRFLAGFLLLFGAAAGPVPVFVPGFYPCGTAARLELLGAASSQGGLAVILVLLAWGGWNARHPVYRQVTVNTAKALPRDVKIAFVTDLHLGTVLGDSYSAELVRRLNAVQPDLIILGGDQVDESLQLVREEGSYKHLADLKAPLGVYAVLGNHDYLGGTWREEIELFSGLGLHYLVNETVTLPDNLELTGSAGLQHGRQPGGFTERSVRQVPYPGGPSAAADAAGCGGRL
jgi:hypothetical protein